MKLQKLKSAIDNFNGTQHIKQLMQRLITYDNIPRKKAKFRNFIRSCLRVTNDYYIDQMWTICETVFKTETLDSDNASPTKRQLNGNQNEVQTNGKKFKTNEKTEQIEELEKNSDIQPKLKMKKIVVDILKERENHEMSLKKLRKRVIKKYRVDNENYSKEDIGSRFDQKINSIKKIVVNEGRVCLK